MKLIHTSDFHLESRMASSFPPSLAAERRRELLLTFKRLFSYAEEKGVAGILIAGDLFDSGRIPVRTVNDVLGTLKAHPHIQVYYLCGNHDENNLSKLSALPENCHTFSKGWTSYTLGGVNLFGTEDFTDERAAELSLPKEGKNVVMLHGQTGEKNGSFGIDLSSLRGKGIDYLALGHLHSHREGKLDERGVYAYAGCPEGRGFDECGTKGFLLLDVGESVKRTFVPFASLTLHEAEVSLTAEDTALYDVEGKAERALSDIPAADMVKIVFRGERNPELSFDLAYFEQLYRARFRFVKAEDQTRLAVFADDFKGDISLKGEFVRLVRASKFSPEMQDKMLECGIRALRGEAEL